MDQELGPVDEALVELFERFRVVGGETDALPPFAGHVGAFDGLGVEVHGACFGVGAHGCVAGVGEGAGLTVAEAADVVFISAEVLFFCCSVLLSASDLSWFFGGREAHLSL